jgi:hypothetical protein
MPRAHPGGALELLYSFQSKHRAHFLRSTAPTFPFQQVRCVLRNIVRDWTSEGAAERSECYAPILAELQSCFSDRDPSNPPSCVVPGAGLGRLPCEISRLGFVCQGNEFSYYTLIVSSFILNMWVSGNLSSVNKPACVLYFV